MNSRQAEVTRRVAIAGMATALGGFVVQAQQAAVEEQQASTANAKRTSLHQEVKLQATKERIFHALLDNRQFAAFTGMPAEIDGKPGGAVKLFGGLIEGRNVEIIDVLRIVQAWRPTSWESGLYSMVHFELKVRGEESTLILDHTGFPEGDYDHLYSGWYARYWDPLMSWLAKQH